MASKFKFSPNLCFDDEQWRFDSLHFLLKFNEFRLTFDHKFVEKWNSRYDKFVDKSSHTLLFDGRNLKKCHNSKEMHTWATKTATEGDICNGNNFKRQISSLLKMQRTFWFFHHICKLNICLWDHWDRSFTWLLSTLSPNIERSGLSFIVCVCVIFLFTLNVKHTWFGVLEYALFVGPSKRSHKNPPH